MVQILILLLSTNTKFKKLRFLNLCVPSPNGITNINNKNVLLIYKMTETETKFQNLIKFKNTFYNSANQNSMDPDGRSTVAYKTSIQNEIKKCQKKN